MHVDYLWLGLVTNPRTVSHSNTELAQPQTMPCSCRLWEMKDKTGKKILVRFLEKAKPVPCLDSYSKKSVETKSTTHSPLMSVGARRAGCLDPVLGLEPAALPRLLLRESTGGREPPGGDSGGARDEPPGERGGSGDPRLLLPPPVLEFRP